VRLKGKDQTTDFTIDKTKQREGSTMKLSKWIGLMVVLAIIVSILAACGSNSEKPAASQSASGVAETAASSETTPGEPAIDISKEVKLKMFLLGDKPKDFDLVYGEINNKLKQDINATVEVEFIGWGEIYTKIPLIFSSGEEYDLIPTANWLTYFPNARNGAYKEITMDDLKKYAPKTVESSAQEVFDSAMVDGKLYALPMNYHETTVYGYTVRGDLMTKYSIPDIKTIDDFEVYLEAVKQNEPDMIPWDTNASKNFVFEELTRPYDIYNLDYGFLGVKLDEAEPKLINLYETPEAVSFFKRMQQWNEKGYWSKGALVNKTTDVESFKSGKSAAFYHNLTNANAAYEVLKTTHPEWDVRFYPTNPEKPYLANPFINNGMAINARTKNYDRALMVLDLFKNNEDYNQLTFYGIKGQHFDVSADHKLIPLEGNAGFPPGSAFPYPWMDDRYTLAPAKGLPNYEAVMAAVNAQQKKTNIRNLITDRTAVKGNEAAIQDITSQFVHPLYLGIVKSTVEDDLKVILDKMNAAGLQDVITEVQKQVDAFETVIK
jgi:putative aldouronate transport system substrate-binding protein